VTKDESGGQKQGAGPVPSNAPGAKPDVDAQKPDTTLIDTLLSDSTLQDENSDRKSVPRKNSAGD
jgi:hypothetical protein